MNSLHLLLGREFILLQTVMVSAKENTLLVKANVDIPQEGEYLSEEPRCSKVKIAQNLAF